MSVDIAKSEYCNIAKSKRLFEIPSTAISIDTVFASTPHVKDLSVTLIVLFTFSRALA